MAPGARAADRVVGARPTVVVVGLGPAGPELTTPAATAAMDAPARFLRTERHLAARPFVDAGVPTFDAHYELATFDDTYRAIVDDLVAAAIAHGRAAYAVPGSPAVLERTVELLRADDRVAVETVPGLSFCDLAWVRLGVDPVNAGVRIVNGEDFAVAAATDRGPLLVGHTWSNAILSAVKLAVEPDPGTRAVICHHLGLDDEEILEVAWEDLDRTLEADHLTSLYVPALARPPAFEIARAAAVVEELRARCPWDAAQTHASLARHLLEESYEALEAIETLGDPPGLAASALLEEELGDVLCQVLFHAVIAQEEGLFGLADVARALADKLVRRHPHVYAPPGEAPADAAASLAAWEERKAVEKGRTSLLDGVPSALPALAYAAKLDRRAHAVGLGLAPRDADRAALDALALASDEDFTSVLLEVAHRAADVGVDAEAALRTGARRFRDAFTGAEELARRRGTSLGALGEAERVALLAEAARTGTNLRP